MSRLKPWAGHSLVFVSLLLLFSTLPLGNAVIFGADEGFEVMKPFLMTKGFSLYHQIWDDQPPLFTLLLKGAFHIWGASILSARVVAAAFGLLLFLVFYELVRLRSGLWPALLATFFLLASPYVLPLSVSVMQEVPTFATALASTALVLRWRQRRGWHWLLLSGLIMGLALQIKFTAVLVVPAILAELALSYWPGRDGVSQPAAPPGSPTGRSWRRGVALDVLVWGASAIATFAVIGLMWAAGSSVIAWKAHATAQPTTEFGSPEALRFPASLLLKHWEVVGAAGFGMLLTILQNRWRECVLPAGLLLTAIAVHTVHRPWWNYYYLHFALPLAWFAGVFGFETIIRARRLLARTRFQFHLRGTWAGVVFLGVIALALAMSERRLERSATSLRRAERLDSSPVLAAIRQYASRTRWMYSDLMIYPFHAGLLAPPDLAVNSLKRVWSGALTTEGIVAVCEHYRPEQLLLVVPPDSAWEPFLDAGYSQVCTNRGLALFVAKRLGEPPGTQLPGR